MVHAVVAFLGNPGSQYTRTRHNVAWNVAEAFGGGRQGAWKNKFNSHYATLVDANTGLQWCALLPQTFMNRSGAAVQAACAFFRVPPQRLLVVHDDAELAFGALTVRLGGGLAGHNGLRSIAETTATREFWRLRMGIGRPPQRIPLDAFVLSRFSTDEEAQVQDMVVAAQREAILWVTAPESAKSGTPAQRTR